MKGDGIEDSGQVRRCNEGTEHPIEGFELVLPGVLCLQQAGVIENESTQPGKRGNDCAIFAPQVVAGDGQQTERAIPRAHRPHDQPPQANEIEYGLRLIAGQPRYDLLQPPGVGRIEDNLALVQELPPA